MALQIYQIAFPTAVIAPQRFFRQLAADLTVATGGTIALNGEDEPFSNDTGASPVTVPAVGTTGYYNFYVNGVMQEGGSFAVTPGTDDVAVITLNVNATFTADTILVLEAVMVS
ncbi:DUF4183 domain-containing protein [Paenibacillus protaetiae]|uniref:DUF4183 domain-containing protein n=1 Tax=Paenibacillus protaetiae TaxID=2509456 RepID=A0A4P6EW75_9BACL|nr:DUF4183 domain-containing protein [Paenibacillus protaetiae]QAY67274.1 DUF4183 domain-containing protein [Paenibacillus protaetiae]